MHGESIVYSNEMHIENILPGKEQTDLMNEWTSWRLEHILPDLMREQDLDMWLIVNREWIEDPVFFSLIHQPVMASPGCAALFFHYDLEKGDIVRYSCSPHGGLAGYQEVWGSRNETQFEALATTIKRCNPDKIGINVSPRWGYGDGLTASLRDDLRRALGSDFASRLVSAGDLCVRWLETRSPQELDFYKHSCGITHEIIREIFSSPSISPEITTLDQIEWRTRDRISKLGLHAWFQPSFSIVRSKPETVERPTEDGIIRRGDLLHCDVGIEYCGLCTDMQWWAYVCKTGEQRAPTGLENALRGATDVAEIFMNEFTEGLTGREIALAALKKAESRGLKPSIYSHPVGVHGHGAGTTFNTVDANKQDERNVLRWNYPLFENTCYAIELSNMAQVHEWNNQEVRIGIEDTAAFAGGDCRYIDGHQTDYILIQ